MTTLTIILAVYVALDIIASIILYAVLRINGWGRYELARRFRDLIAKPADDFLEEIADELHDDFIHYEDGIEVR
jgi:hypothetical protein